MYLGSGTNDTLQKVLLARLSTDSKFTEVTIWEPVEINAQLLSAKYMLKDHISVHREQATNQPIGESPNLTYIEHDVIRDNSVEFKRKEGDRYWINWSGTTSDVNFYDGSKPDTLVKVEGWFRIESH